MERYSTRWGSNIVCTGDEETTHKHNDFTGLERIEAAVNHEEPDRIPVFPLITYALARHVGYTVFEFSHDPRKLFKAISYGYEKFGYDGIIAYADVYLFAEAAGLKLEFPSDSVPNPSKSPINSIEDVEKLAVPDVYRDGRIPVLLEAIRLTSEKYGDKVAIYSGGQGPFSLAAEIRGLTNFLKDLYVNEELASKLVKYATEYMVELGKAQAEAGAHILHLGDSFAGPSIISPNRFAVWAAPNLKEVFQAWRSCGAITSLHICGDSSLIWPQIEETGTNIFEVDYLVNILEAKNFFNGKVCLMGNIDPARVLHRGAADNVIDEGRKCIMNAASGGGYILGSGCLIMPGFPPENISALVETAESYGRYTYRAR